MTPPKKSSACASGSMRFHGATIRDEGVDDDALPGPDDEVAVAVRRATHRRETWAAAWRRENIFFFFWRAG
jgi:hypothetical protein